MKIERLNLREFVIKGMTISELAEIYSRHKDNSHFICNAIIAHIGSQIEIPNDDFIVELDSSAVIRGMLQATGASEELIAGVNRSALLGSLIDLWFQNRKLVDDYLHSFPNADWDFYAMKTEGFRAKMFERALELNPNFVFPDIVGTVEGEYED